MHACGCSSGKFCVGSAALGQAGPSQLLPARAPRATSRGGGVQAARSTPLQVGLQVQDAAQGRQIAGQVLEAVIGGGIAQQLLRGRGAGRGRVRRQAAATGRQGGGPGPVAGRRSQARSRGRPEQRAHSPPCAGTRPQSQRHSLRSAAGRAAGVGSRGGPHPPGTPPHPMHAAQPAPLLRFRTCRSQGPWLPAGGRWRRAMSSPRVHTSRCGGSAGGCACAPTHLAASAGKSRPHRPSGAPAGRPRACRCSPPACPASCSRGWRCNVRPGQRVRGG